MKVWIAAESRPIAVPSEDTGLARHVTYRCQQVFCPWGQPDNWISGMGSRLFDVGFGWFLTKYLLHVAVKATGP